MKRKTFLALCYFLLAAGFVSAQEVRSDLEKQADTSTTVIEPSFLKFNEKDIELKADFARNRGKLPWPVDNGFVSSPFGYYKAGGGCCVSGNNPGLTIETTTGCPVKTVFDGVIAAVLNFDEGETAILVKHGKYYTCYSNLSVVNVAKGDIVTCGQVIGKAGDSDDRSRGRVDFMLMLETKNVNPQPWLR